MERNRKGRTEKVKETAEKENEEREEKKKGNRKKEWKETGKACVWSYVCFYESNDVVHYIFCRAYFTVHASFVMLDYCL